MQLYLGLKLMVFVQTPDFSDYMWEKKGLERFISIFKLLCKCDALAYKPANICASLG